MLRTYLYIPDELNKKIKHTAKLQRKSKAAVVREALEEGLKITSPQSGADVLLKLAEMAKKYRVKGPRDASINHDYYLWGFPKKGSGD